MPLTNFKIKNHFVYSPDCNVESLKHLIAHKLVFTLGRDPALATNHDWLSATLYATRDRIIESWLLSNRAQHSQDTRQVYYLSMEFLLGRVLSNALLSLGLYELVSQALNEMGLDLETLIAEEHEPGLGNGGLGRLAACFLDSLATLRLPGRAYGIRYEYGMFQQQIVDGQQAEAPDNWAEDGYPWEIPHTNIHHKVYYGGRLQQEGNKTHWVEREEMLACPYDHIIPGYDTKVTTTLRLWTAKASNEINLGKFNQGDYFAAVEDKNHSENVSRVLYPDDSTSPGYQLRLIQEYFLVTASLQDILRRHQFEHKTLDNLADKVAIHLNDTHPVLAIPELMRLLIDNHDFEWLAAWDKVTRIFSYTNHTLLSEALETWPVSLMGKLLPRHLQLIFEINDHFLKSVQNQTQGDNEFIKRISLIDEENGRRVRMAWLAIVGSHKVNGVSKLHSELMVQSIFADFAKLYPDRFCNITNGVTQRRWLVLANKPLTNVINDAIGTTWHTKLDSLSELKPYADYPSFLKSVHEAKYENKMKLVAYVAQKLNLAIDANALFDVHIKRFHEYKRQLLNILHVITRYNRILAEPDRDWQARVIIFAGKASSAYKVAKQVIHLINDVATIVNNDPRTNDKLKVVFIPNYSVSLAQLIIPATDLSEQISLAGTEASGTSNMKFALNGALTIGTYDGANIEICEHVGRDNIFIFGNDAKQVAELRKDNYIPHQYYENDPELHLALTQIATGVFSPTDPTRYHNLFDLLVNLGDYYQLLADYRSYIDTQDQVDELYKKPDAWYHKTVMNITNMGYFSSDRAVLEYSNNIWHLNEIQI